MSGESDHDTDRGAHPGEDQGVDQSAEPDLAGMPVAEDLDQCTDAHAGQEVQDDAQDETPDKERVIAGEGRRAVPDQQQDAGADDADQSGAQILGEHRLFLAKQAAGLHVTDDEVVQEEQQDIGKENEEACSGERMDFRVV